MARKASITAQPKTLKDGTIVWRPKYGRRIVGGYVATEEEAKANGYAWLGFAKDPSQEPLTVSEWYARWTETDEYTTAKGRSEGTVSHYRERVKLFVDEFGDMNLADVTRVAARTWATKNPARAREVRTMFADAVSDEIVASNPFAKLDVEAMAVQTRKKISPLTEPEVQALADTAIEAIDNEAFAPMFANAILFAAYSGLRLGELSALCWEDINFDKSTILLYRQWLSKQRKHGPLKGCKPGETRLIVLFPQALEALKAIRDTYGTLAPEALVFQTPNGDRLNARNHWHYWSPTRAMYLGSLPKKRIVELRGESQQALHWHDLRHFTASWLVNGGAIAARDAAVQLGHKDGGALIQELYAHTYEDEARARMLAAKTPSANGKAKRARAAKGA